jgi:phosphoglycerate dehydrogenase-like enzyme
MTKILASARLSDDILQRLQQIGEVDVNNRSKKTFLSEEELCDRVRDVDVIVTEGDVISAAVLESAPRLQLVATCRGNPVNVDIEAATRLGVLVTNAPGRNADAVAELTVALMVMCARHVMPAAEALRDGRWYNRPRAWAYLTFQGVELQRRVVGLVGLGIIGRKTAALLNAFGMKCLAYDPYVSPDQAEALNIELTSLDDLLRRSDFVSLHAAVTNETTGMIGAAQFDLMKPTAYLLNTARAALVDEDAMLQALREGRIAGAGLDVFHREPLPPDDPLLELDNVIVTPHIGGATGDVVRHHSEIVYDDIVSVVDGQTPIHLVNPDALPLYHMRFGSVALHDSRPQVG